MKYSESSVIANREMIDKVTPERDHTAGRDLAIDYLRSFVIVLVVFMHAFLAYTPLIPFDPTSYVNSAAPVVDPNRWAIFDFTFHFLDMFLMPLMFLISGLFTLPSLDRKGSGRFLAKRYKRLGLPYLVASVALMPFAHWPSRLLSSAPPDPPHWIAFFTVGGWPAGPLWFLWVLLVFNSIFALMYRYTPSIVEKIRYQPTVFMVFLLTILTYLPMGLIFPHWLWAHVGGPFYVQTNRIVLYFIYFVLGAALGAGQGLESTRWPSRWGWWALVGVVSFLVYSVSDPAARIGGLTLAAILNSVAFSTGCAGTSLASLGAFRQLVYRNCAFMDSLAANAYGIYIVHYCFITWLQFALISVSWPAWMKCAIVFTLGLGMSWGASAILRRIPGIRRVL